MLIDWVLVDVLFSAAKQRNLQGKSEKVLCFCIPHPQKVLVGFFTEPSLVFLTIIYYMIPLQYYFKFLVVGLMNKSQGTVFWGGVSAFLSVCQGEQNFYNRGFCCFAHLGCHGTVHLVPCCHSGSTKNMPENLSQGSFLRHVCSRSLGCPKIMNCGFGATRS